MWFETDERTPLKQFASREVEDILLELSKRAFSGLAQYEVEDRSAQILFDEGFILEILTRPVRDEEEFGAMLRLGEQISKDELERAREHAEREHRTLRSVLYELEILSAEQLRRAATGRLNYLVNQLCDGPGATIDLYEPPFDGLDDLPPPALRAHVAPEQIIFRRRFERFSQLTPEEWEGMIDVYGEMFPRRSDGTSGRLERAFNDPAHRRLGRDFIDDYYSFEHILTESPLPPGETIAVVSALRSMDLVEFRTTVGPGIRSKRFADLVEEKHLSVHKASYYEVLNVHWSSYDEVADRAYEQLKIRYDADGRPDGLSPEIKRKAEEIAERLETAYEVLRHRETRHKYRRKIMPDYKLAHAIPLLSKKADLARRRDQIELARDAYRRVLEIEPGHEDATCQLDELQDSQDA